MNTYYTSDESLYIFSKMDALRVLGTVETLRPSATVDEKIIIYGKWIEVNQTDPIRYAVYFNYGSALSGIGRVQEAGLAFEAAINANPDFMPPYINIGFAYERLGMPEKAIEAWTVVANRLSVITTENIGYKTMALKQIGRLREFRSELRQCEDILRISIDIDPTQRDVLQHWTVARQRQCKWPSVVALPNCTEETILKTLAPVSLSAYTDDPLMHLGCSYAYNRNDVGWPTNIHTAGSWITPEAPRSRPLRVAYLSSDYRHHAIGFLMAEIFEHHDRSAVKVFVYYCGPESPDFVQHRIKASVEHWVDINGLSNEEAARRILDDEIDILIDVNGYTNFARTSLLALKPAPIIVNWLGYPGTMGSPYHNYIIADDYIIPKDYEMFYSEQVVRLPCYQPNDSKREIPPPTTTRAMLGLPEDAMVYCCFNGLQKVTPVVFRCWMEILKQTPGSVLWLLVDAQSDRERLQQLAAEAGVSPDRLYFAGWASNRDHLARYHLADVVLDTWPYGAHTTASDALWMGVPVVTLSGRSFASRVCGSLAISAGVGDLVCKTQEEYISKAINIGKSRAIAAHYKEFLTYHRYNSTLFNTEKLVRRLEELYAEMWSKFENGVLPQPDLTNLDIYHDIGAAMHKTNTDALPDKDYFELYRRNLSYRHSFSPIPPDSRLWKNPA